jgi:hypothetical protein
MEHASMFQRNIVMHGKRCFDANRTGTHQAADFRAFSIFDVVKWRQKKKFNENLSRKYFK